ncbi:hypothetical protein R6Q57_009129, partial [Mikania cordata]
MRVPWQSWLLLFLYQIHQASGQDDANTITLPKEVEACNGIFLQYTFKSEVIVLNTSTTELKSWQAFIGFQHDEILVPIDGATVLNGDSFPLKVEKNGTHLTGNLATKQDKPLLLPSFKVGNKVTVEMTTESVHVCCTKDPKYKQKKKTTLKFFPRQQADLSIIYDVIDSYKGNYKAEITLENHHPLGRLDHWNLTFEWMRNKFIYDMRGAFTRSKDPSECLYSAAGQYYQDFDFSKKCGQPVCIDPTETPYPSGVEATITAIGTYQVACNITKAKPKTARCCVSFSAYYADSVIPCNTCACGCEDDDTRKRDEDARALPLPAEALLVPFANRKVKACAWAKIKHFDLPRKLPCADNCLVSLNWHLDSDYKTGWT